MDQPLDDIWAECEDLFAQARQTLATLKVAQPGHVVQASVNALFRTTHTLKGMAGMMGFPSFSRAAHRMEDIFDLMRKGRLRSTDSLIETLESGMLALESGLAGLRRGRPEPDDYLHAMRRQLGELEALARPVEGVAQDLSSLLDLPPEVLKALSDYERMRVTALLMNGTPIHGISVCLDFATFDERLRALSEAVGASGELISTLPWDVPDGREGLAFLLMTAAPVLDPATTPPPGRRAPECPGAGRSQQGSHQPASGGSPSHGSSARAGSSGPAGCATASFHGTGGRNPAAFRPSRRRLGSPSHGRGAAA